MLRAVSQQLMPGCCQRAQPNYFIAKYEDGAASSPRCPQHSCQKVQSCPLPLPRRRSRNCQVPETSVSQWPCTCAAAADAMGLVSPWVEQQAAAILAVQLVALGDLPMLTLLM